MIQINYEGAWKWEQELFKLVEDGNVDYRSEIQKIVKLQDRKETIGIDIFRHNKNNIIIMSALAARAAIRGGLTPEMAYTVGDIYIFAAENSATVEELSLVFMKMMDDFICRVHMCKTESGMSKAVSDCCNHINLHIDEDVSIETLAAKTGYTKYYLSKKFKKETGRSIANYIKHSKVERAKHLLFSTNLSVLEISRTLGFSSQNYLSNTFKSVTGLTPLEYRAQNFYKN